MFPIDPLHRLVPIAAAHRLGDRTRVHFLTLRQVLAGLAGQRAVLLQVGCELPQILAPTLRAARDQDAVLAISALSLAGPRRRHEFFHLVTDLVEETGFTRPLVLAAPPVAVADGDDIETAWSRLLELVDAGYTHVAVDATGLELSEAADTLVRILEPIASLSYGVELHVSDVQALEAGELVASMKLLGGAPHVMAVLAEGGWALESLAEEVRPTAVAWHETGAADTIRDALPAAMAADARIVELTSPLLAAFVSGLPEDLRRDVQSDLDEGLHASLSRRLDALEALDEDALDRAEARVYAQATHLLGTLGLKRTGGAVRQALLS